MNWVNKLFGTIFGGDDFGVGTGADADSTAAKVNGALAFKTVASGGPWGAGYGSITYRITGEPNMDPSFVHRFHSYTWECDDLTWMMNLNPAGLMLGGHVSDAMPFPRDRLDVRRGNMRIHNDSHNYSRLESSTGDTYMLFSSGTPDAANPKWAIGRGSSLGALGHGDDFILAKYKGDEWVYVATLGVY